MCSFLDVYEDTETGNQSIWKYDCDFFIIYWNEMPTTPRMAKAYASYSWNRNFSSDW